MKLRLVSSFLKKSYIKYVENHKNSKGESAPWCIFKHNTDKLLSSYSTKAEAEKALQRMHIFKKGNAMKFTFNSSLSPHQIESNENFFKQVLNTLTEGGTWVWPDEQSLFIKQGDYLLGNERALNSARQIVSPEFYEAHFGPRN